LKRNIFDSFDVAVLAFKEMFERAFEAGLFDSDGISFT
jgi:hypothetical protein